MEENKSEKKCAFCQKDIPLLAKKCPHCQSDLRPWHMKHQILLFFLGIAVLLLIVGMVNLGNQAATTQGTTASDGWYYVTSNYQCVKATNEYKNEDSCAQDMGTRCHYSDPTCSDLKKLTLYYIDSTNHCVLAPHNPYSPLESPDMDGNAAQEDACQKDVSQPCYVDDNTCGGVGNPGMITIGGMAYKSLSVKELKQIIANPDYAQQLGIPASAIDVGVAVKGTINTILPWNNGSGYEVIMDTGNGIVDVSISTTNSSVPDLRVGTKILAGGDFLYKDINGKPVNLFSSLLTSPYIGPQLSNLKLSSDTPVISTVIGSIEKVQ